MGYKALQWLTRTAVTYRRQTVCILQYWFPDGCWPHSDMCHCLFCLAWLWLIPFPPRSHGQYLAARLHPWTTGPGLVWGIKNKQFLLFTCCIMTRCPPADRQVKQVWPYIGLAVETHSSFRYCPSCGIISECLISRWGTSVKRRYELQELSDYWVFKPVYNNI